jgi:hypothetical protein
MYTGVESPLQDMPLLLKALQVCTGHVARLGDRHSTNHSIAMSPKALPPPAPKAAAGNQTDAAGGGGGGGGGGKGPRCAAATVMCGARVTLSQKDSALMADTVLACRGLAAQLVYHLCHFGQIFDSSANTREGVRASLPSNFGNGGGGGGGGGKSGKQSASKTGHGKGGKDGGGGGGGVGGDGSGGVGSCDCRSLVVKKSEESKKHIISIKVRDASRDMIGPVLAAIHRSFTELSVCANGDDGGAAGVVNLSSVMEGDEDGEGEKGSAAAPVKQPELDSTCE